MCTILLVNKTRTEDRVTDGCSNYNHARRDVKAATQSRFLIKWFSFQ